MSEIDFSNMDYPIDAMHVRNLIAEMMRSQVDQGTEDMDTGGGFGAADLWMTIGGTEFIVTVKPVRKPGE